MNKQDIYYNEGRKVTLISMVVNSFVVIMLFITGLLSKSQALIAEAFHSFSDFGSDILVLFGLKFSKKPADDSHPYGHGKVETLAVLILGTALILIGAKLFHRNIILLINKQTRTFNYLIITAPLITIILKETLYRYMKKIATKLKSKLIMANAWHTRLDVLAAITVFIGFIGISMGFKALDQWIAIIMAILIVKVGYTFSKDAIRDLLEASIEQEVINNIELIVKSVSGVLSLHKVRGRYVGHMIILDLHIQVNENIPVKEGHEIANLVSEALYKSNDKIGHVLVHIEPHEK